MRAIKFRAWYKKSKSWLEVVTITLEGHLLFPWAGDEPGDEDVELVQFTGLKDRYGKEIYESDIVMWDGGQYTVTFSEREGSWILKDDRDDWECPSLYGVSSPKQSRMVIIGNTYQPKEEWQWSR